jgi:hypothetical protein
MIVTIKTPFGMRWGSGDYVIKNGSCSAEQLIKIMRDNMQQCWTLPEPGRMSQGRTLRSSQDEASRCDRREFLAAISVARWRGIVEEPVQTSDGAR